MERKYDYPKAEVANLEKADGLQPSYQEVFYKIYNFKPFYDKNHEEYILPDPVYLAILKIWHSFQDDYGKPTTDDQDDDVIKALIIYLFYLVGFDNEIETIKENKWFCTTKDKKYFV